jgi:UDP-N-acetylmuramyl pentapeptide phosphotransferase/UDP-N-acetylglucosamine-1-phosphate transferase
MFSFLVSFVLSALLTLLVIKHSKLYGPALDNNFDGVQKVHMHSVARIGGLPIFVAVALTVTISAWRVPDLASWLAVLLACSSIAFAGGIVEDYTGKVRPSRRLLLTMAAAVLGYLALDAKIARLDMPFFSWNLDSLGWSCR